jgi:hypothetical protein
MKDIYPDTVIWNLLFNQNVEPETLLKSLKSRGYTLALSFHTVYEPAKNFERDDPNGLTRGRLGNPVEGERDSVLKPNTIPL